MKSEPSYSIGIANRFGMIDSDEVDDPYEFKPVAQAKEKVPEPVVKPAPAAGKTSASGQSAASRTNQAQVSNGPQRGPAQGQQQQQRGPRGPTGNVDGQRQQGNRTGPRPERGPRPNYDGQPQVDRPPRPPREPRNFGGDGQGNDRVRRPPRPEGEPFGSSDAPMLDGGKDVGPRNNNRGGGGRGPDGQRPPRFPANRTRRNPDGKREFERRSGSNKAGVKPTDKREGSGSHNWGTMEDELAGQAEGASTEDAPMQDDAAGNTSSNSVEGGAKDDKENAEPAAEPKEEEPVTKTLAEWKAEQQALRVKPQYNLRKAGEGEDMKKWNKANAREYKKNPQEHEEGVEYEEVEVEVKVKEPKKNVLDLNIRFKDERRDMRRAERGPGGRGGPGGDRRTGGPRGPGGFGDAAGSDSDA